MPYKPRSYKKDPYPYESECEPCKPKTNRFSRTKKTAYRVEDCEKCTGTCLDGKILEQSEENQAKITALKQEVKRLGDLAEDILEKEEDECDTCDHGAGSCAKESLWCSWMGCEKEIVPRCAIMMDWLKDNEQPAPA